MRPPTDGTPYAYTVHGEDAAGNIGADSSEAELVARSGVACYLVLVNGVATGPRASDTSLELTGLPIASAHHHRRRRRRRRQRLRPVLPSLRRRRGARGAVDLTATTPTREKPELTWPAVDEATEYIVAPRRRRAGPRHRP